MVGTQLALIRQLRLALSFTQARGYSIGQVPPRGLERFGALVPS